MKIFILDDDEISNELSKIILNLSGMLDIDIRTTVFEAISYLSERARENAFPDILFVDLDLPGMDGFAFIEYYEKHYKKKFPDARIVMLTNSVIEEDRIRALKYESVSDFWTKPLTVNNLNDIIRSRDVKT